MWIFKSRELFCFSQCLIPRARGGRRVSLPLPRGRKEHSTTEKRQSGVESTWHPTLKWRNEALSCDCVTTGHFYGIRAKVSELQPLWVDSGHSLVFTQRIKEEWFLHFEMIRQIKRTLFCDMITSYAIWSAVSINQVLLERRLPVLSVLFMSVSVSPAGFAE